MNNIIICCFFLIIIAKVYRGMIYHITLMFALDNIRKNMKSAEFRESIGVGFILKKEPLNNYRYNIFVFILTFIQMYIYCHHFRYFYISNVVTTVASVMYIGKVLE